MAKIYWRQRKSGRFAYLDARDFADVGGGQEALVAPGEKRATTDPDVAIKLAADRIRQLEERRRSKSLTGLEQRRALARYAQYHLIEKAKANRVDQRQLDAAFVHLSRAVEFFGSGRLLDTITARDASQYAAWLSSQPNRRGGVLSAGTVRHHLNSLSNLYRRAGAEGAVLPGYNPVSAMLDKPVASRSEADWLEVDEAAEYLAAAQLVKRELPIYELVATFLLTGGRRAEVLGLTGRDVNLQRKTVTFRPNEYRGLKTATSHRVVPLWPQLEGVIGELAGASGNGLLFPSVTGGMIRDLRKSLDAVSVSIGWPTGRIRTRIFRHTYCAARLQTLDNGAPVSEYTVSREMGHGGPQMVRRVYSHLGTIRHRSEVVEYV